MSVADESEPWAQALRRATGLLAEAGVLTEGQVRAIRALPVPPTREGLAAHYRTLAAQYDVSEMTVYRVVQGRTWRHLLDDDADA